MILIEQGEIGRPIPDLQDGVFDPGRFELSGGPVHGGDYLGSRIVGRSSRLKSCFKFFETISQLRHGPPYPGVQHPRHYDVADRTAFQSICTPTAKEKAALKSTTKIFCHRFDCCFVNL
jgi:hypothetical protein